MKATRKFLSLFLILALLCLPVFASCGAAEGNNGSSETVTTKTDEPVTQPESEEAEETEEPVSAVGYTVTFSVDEHVTVTVYQTQADMTGGVNGEPVTVAVSREAESGNATDNGTGQVNFVLSFDDGFELDQISINKESGNGYTNLKGSADTGVSGGYRITKITSDLTVTVTSKSAEEAEDLTQGYAVTFAVGEHVSVTVLKQRI